jgi:hypothetical protein
VKPAATTTKPAAATTTKAAEKPAGRHLLAPAA